MNILYTNFHHGDGGGHTTYILALLQNLEHLCHVACPGSSRLYGVLRERDFERLVEMDFPGKLGEIAGTVRNTVQLARYIDTHDIDIVHTSGSGDNRMAFYASLFCKKKFKVVFTKHNSFPIKGPISQWRFNKNDGVIFVSKSIYDTIGFSNFKTRIAVIENGIDLDYWSRSAPLETGRELTFVSTAGTADSKGWRFLLEGVSGLDDSEKSRIKVVLLGAELPAESMDQARQACRVEFPGFLADTRPFLERADIGFVLSYSRETISFACREMMSMSLPVLVSRYAGLPDNIDEFTGWLTEPKNSESIRAVLRKILAMSPEELTQMKRAARDKAVRDFGIGKMLKATNVFYAALF